MTSEKQRNVLWTKFSLRCKFNQEINFPLWKVSDFEESLIPYRPWPSNSIYFLLIHRAKIWILLFFSWKGYDNTHIPLCISWMCTREEQHDIQRWEKNCSSAKRNTDESHRYAEGGGGKQFFVKVDLEAFFLLSNSNINLPKDFFSKLYDLGSLSEKKTGLCGKNSQAADPHPHGRGSKYQRSKYQCS